MPPDHLREFALLNGLKFAERPYPPYELTDTPPAGARAIDRHWPCHDEATCFVSAGKPACIVIETFGGHDLRRLGDLVKWLKLETHVPPTPHEDGRKKRIVIARQGFGAPVWPSEAQAA